MGTPANPEASEIRRRGRQRLLGAVAIALLLIVFVPMLLDSEPRPARDDARLAIPSKENAPPLPAPVPAPAPAPAPASAQPAPSAAAPAPSAATPKAEPKPAAPAAKVAVVDASKASPPKSPPPGAAPKQGFAVQVGAFRDEAKLAQAREKLQAAKVAHYTEAAGELTRLRAGPFATKDAAEKAATTIRRTIPDAKVVPLP